MPYNYNTIAYTRHNYVRFKINHYGMSTNYERSLYEYWWLTSLQTGNAVATTEIHVTEGLDGRLSLGQRQHAI